MFSGTNFAPSCLSWRRSSSATKPQRPSSLVAMRRDLLLIGGLPSFVRFPRLIKCSSSASSSPEDEVAPVVDYGSSITSGSNSPEAASVVNGLDASVWALDGDLRAPVSSSSHSPDDVSVVDGLEANYRLSVTSVSNSPYAAAIADGLDAIFRSPASSSISTAGVADSQLKYDVFISFRGPDSGDGFVSHLYDDLCRAGIETFLDRAKLVPGEEIEPALSDAIERSRISLVVFTKDYASSRWCLRELARIMVCRRSRGQLVLPVFLGVKAMEVRWQTGCYDVAFSRDHKAPVGSLFADEVKRWRKAMTDSANLSGFSSTAVR